MRLMSMNLAARSLDKRQRAAVLRFDEAQRRVEKLNGDHDELMKQITPLLDRIGLLRSSLDEACRVYELELIDLTTALGVERVPYESLSALADKVRKLEGVPR